MFQEEPMSQDRFEQVTVVKKANVYFDGNVTSRTVLFPDGTRKTLGVMLPGSYEFGTGAAELMEVLNGEMNVLLPGAADWRVYKTGDSFGVPANAKFKLQITGVADYCCSYLP
jgi:purine/pyrimidine-nucleoside phosphorylase